VKVAYVWNRNGIGRSFFTKIADHVLDQDRALSDLLVDSDISSIRALECEFASRHIGRLRMLTARLSVVERLMWSKSLAAESGSRLIPVRGGTERLINQVELDRDILRGSAEIGLEEYISR
jgi:hypothetical protein